jgi:predicted flap endonuclease-1-like 5' DNA nuclease
MFNAAHILETALIMLAAFVIGAVLGSLAKAVLRRKPAAVVPATLVTPAATTGPDLVTAPVIEPISAPAVPVASTEVPVPDFAATMIALANAPLPEIRQMPAIAPLPPVEGAVQVSVAPTVIEPARVAGETTSGRQIASPLETPEPPASVAVDVTRSADILQFPTEAMPVTPSLTDVAAELESLLTQAVAADAEAPKTDAEVIEQATEDPRRPDSAAVAMTEDPTKAAEPDSKILSLDDTTAEAMAAMPPVVPDAEATISSLEEAGAGNTSEEPVQTSRADAKSSPDGDAAAFVAEVPPLVGEPEVAETALEDVGTGGVPELLLRATEPGVSKTLEDKVAPAVAAPEREGEQKLQDDTPQAAVVATEPPLDVGTIGLQPVALTAADVRSVAPSAAPVLAQVEPVELAEPVPVMRSAEEDEAAAMRAIEGNWSPRQKVGKHRRKAPAPDGVTEAEDAVKASGAAVAAAAEAAQAVVEAAPDPNKPHGIIAPRNGRSDELTNVIGILPIIETALNALGIYHFDQVAELTDKQMAWVETHLGIDGRISREHWREQAVELAALGNVKVAEKT